MFAKLRSLLPALAVGMAAGIPSAPAFLRGAAPAVDYRQPSWGRHSNQRMSRGPGISPARRGPHSEPQVHVRVSNGAHYWYPMESWAALPPGTFTLPGDVVEYIDGYGAVTKRERVPA